MASNFPGVPSKEIPRSRARTLFVSGGEVCGSRATSAVAGTSNTNNARAIFTLGCRFIGDLENNLAASMAGVGLFLCFERLGQGQYLRNQRHDLFCFDQFRDFSEL